MPERVTLTIEGPLAYVKLNRPDKHNALDMDMFFAIDTTIDRIHKNQSIRAVVVSGEGASFCSGLDIKSVLSSGQNALRLLWKWLPGNANLAQRVSIGWRRLDIPVIMALHGKCWGGGMQIALGGDFRIASSDCTLAIMESRWGLIPDMGGTPALRECVGLDQAMRLTMTSDTISAHEALHIGLITQVHEQPLDAATTLANALVNRSPDTNKTVKRLYQKIWNGRERRILAQETFNQIRIILGKNQRIAVQREMHGKDIPFKK
ncbi:crotonase/enoyl-CoA hydratase family protein [Alteromonas flava]|uniref:crotonase/enoyl-CoA hydratase family protein n=1 Tax=Alteromonas flava TaxID=2048003 RepID=UPI000C285355|nr:crotonase/enoyl-CoA hydratase family protein [Alteromonas flava]